MQYLIHRTTAIYSRRNVCYSFCKKRETEIPHRKASKQIRGSFFIPENALRKKRIEK
uniref:Uncharacterized protein n=1 Tax=Setaria italica TaxID=4555 RepID=K3ZYY7_SETIT